MHAMEHTQRPARLNILGQPVEPALPTPAPLTSLPDYEQQARQHIEASAWQHIQGGADQQHTLAHNRAVFDALRLLPQPLADLSAAHTRQTLLGQPLEHPILLAPVAYQTLAHPEGELASVRAATALQAGMVASTLSSHTLEAIAHEAQHARSALQRRGPLWFQLYSQAKRQHTLELVQRAESAGYEAIVWTVDASIKRSGFALPAGVQAANLRHIAPRPQASSIDGPPLFGTPLVQQAPSWDELRWLRAHPAAAGCQRRVAPGAGPPAGRCGGGCPHHLQPRRAGAGRRGQPAGSAARHRPGGACAAAAR